MPSIEALNRAVIRRDFASSIKTDRRFSLPFYYENADMPPVRLRFATWNEAAEDLAIEIDVDDEERASVKRRSPNKERDNGSHR